MDVSAKLVDQLMKTMESADRWEDGRVDAFFCNNPVSKTRYRGFNKIMLYYDMLEKKYPVNKYLTFNQARGMEAKVRKGEKSVRVMFWKIVDKDGETFPLLKWYNVFNVSQVDGLPPAFYEAGTTDMVEDADALIESYITHEDIFLYETPKTPCYVPQLDAIKMPRRESFKTKETYYEAFIHEMVHSTGHESRLNRDLKNSYASEEIVAEFGAMSILVSMGIIDNIKNMSAYIKSWWSALDKDPKKLIAAIGKADKASDYIIGAAHEKAEAVA